MDRINKTAAAVNRILRVSQYNRNGTLRIVGEITTETVTLHQPAVVVGVDVDALLPDEASHWMPIKFEGVAYALDVDNTARGVPYTGVMLVKKSAGVAANAFGVEYA